MSCANQNFDADQPEGRDHLVYLHGTREGPVSFTPYPGYKERWTVAVPASLSFRADDEHGVVLEDIYGNRLTAEQVVKLAYNEQPGFRILFVQVFADWAPAGPTEGEDVCPSTTQSLWPEKLGSAGASLPGS